ncbi:hypothetical protein AAL_06150 [Moelleriella libera RCEF 2490]|uniref:Glutathione S-transferase UstS-like C-terminal domain-containing protein n=1 Tax=Moelleriella libera RCEF 2490 TaxID=1081109 RepID=A0A167ZDP9_9HYPO|nr:hypothetical protein AAL_06150 [Moelleriella libera RCEF 2490]
MATTATTTTGDSAAAEPPLVFYDIGHRPPVTETCCSVNPWKARLALNFKAVPYTTRWVKMPDIRRVRSGLGLPACRKFADGSDFYTLPILRDASASSSSSTAEDGAAGGAVVLLGDSFDIAVHLQRAYPTAGAGDLFPRRLQQQLGNFAVDLSSIIPLSETTQTGSGYPEYAAFNTSVDAAFSAHVALIVDGLPLDPETADATRAEFVQRAGLRSWDDFRLEGEARAKMVASLRNTLGDLAKLFPREDATTTTGGTAGPFLMGHTTTYADFIVGAWLRMLCVTLPADEWQAVRGWHGGVFGRLHDALDRWAEVK